MVFRPSPNDTSFDSEILSLATTSLHPWKMVVSKFEGERSWVNVNMLLQVTYPIRPESDVLARGGEECSKDTGGCARLTTSHHVHRSLLSALRTTICLFKINHSFNRSSAGSRPSRTNGLSLKLHFGKMSFGEKSWSRLQRWFLQNVLPFPFESNW